MTGKDARLQQHVLLDDVRVLKRRLRTAHIYPSRRRELRQVLENRREFYRRLEAIVEAEMDSEGVNQND
jgi:hypothetical protein